MSGYQVQAGLPNPFSVAGAGPFPVVPVLSECEAVSLLSRSAAQNVANGRAMLPPLIIVSDVEGGAGRLAFLDSSVGNYVYRYVSSANGATLTCVQ